MADSRQHYTVLARRFRPQTFSEVVGQEHVAQALRNAIKSGRVAHAYLFTGARGVGKTSMARILAKSLNCPETTDGNPCNQCEICRGITSGSDFDVLEIDGASNRGIDDIRTLRSNVNVKSMRTRYKMYIIDEVHMLTKEAFNALLKTLEEPPPNVKFVFCTTEPNKVPETILSRCQRFDFASIETASIVARLQQIAEAEGIDVEATALQLVARRATGSMRDSQSLFDQLLAFGGETITAGDVHRLFGTAGDDRLTAIVDAVIQQRRDLLLQELQGALSDGVHVGELVDQLLNYLRDLMVIASGAGSLPLLGVSEESRQKLEAQAKQWGLATIVAAMQILAETKNRMFRASHPRALAELGLIRLALLENLEELAGVIEGLKPGRSDRRAGGRQASSPSARPQSRPPERPREKKSPDEAAETEPEGQDPKRETAGAVTELRPGAEQQIQAQLLAQASDRLRPHLQAARDLAISGPNDLEVVFPKSYSFSKQYCERADVSEELNRLATKLVGKPVRVGLRLEVDSAEAGPAVSAPHAEPLPKSEEIRDAFVEQAVSVFGGTVIKVEPITIQPSEKE